MRELLSTHYRSPAGRLTLTPWALLEPPSPLKIDLAERSAIFGDARLALMYSGNFGRAHSYTEIVDLAARLSDSSVKIAFSIRGNRAADLEQTNIKIVPFATEDQLAARLSAPDIHIVTLREEWTGTVVPSKFFGALAAGRPVLFIGSQHSSIAMWIRQYKVGWVLGPETATELRSLEPAQLARLFHHCHTVYQENFSKEKVIKAFNDQLEELSQPVSHPRLSALIGG
jgi:glycosyltransferase involved in cell wall biosynthesis